MFFIYCKPYESRVNKEKDKHDFETVAFLLSFNCGKYIF